MKKIILLVSLFCSVSVFPGERNVGLDECINIALQNHTALFVSIEDQKKSVADYQVAKSVKSVLINGVVRTERYSITKQTKEHSIKFPGDEDTYTLGLFAGLTFNYNLFDEKTGYQQEYARNGIDVSKLRSQIKKNEIVFNVKVDYYNFMLSRSILKIREEINVRYKNKSNLAKKLFEQGARPILDVSKAELDMADSQLNYEKSKNDERKSRLDLFQAMGIEDTENVSLNPEDVDTVPELKCSLDELFKMAEIYSPELRILMLEKRAAKIRISEEDASHYPKVDMMVSFGYKDENLYGKDYYSQNFKLDNWTPVVFGILQATLPVYTGGRISARVDSLTCDYNKIQYKEKELLIDIKNRIRDNYKSLEEIKNQMELSILVKKNAQSYLLLTQKSYENGAGSLMELQDAELSVIRAEIGYFQAKYGYLLNLAKLSGIIGIGESYICKDRE